MVPGEQTVVVTERRSFFQRIFNFEGNYLLVIVIRLPFTRSMSTIEILEQGVKYALKTLEWRQWHRFSVFIVNFEHISHHFLVFLLLL